MYLLGDKIGVLEQRCRKTVPSDHHVDVGWSRAENRDYLVQFEETAIEGLGQLVKKHELESSRLDNTSRMFPGEGNPRIFISIVGDFAQDMTLERTFKADGFYFPQGGGSSAELDNGRAPTAAEATEHLSEGREGRSLCILVVYHEDCASHGLESRAGSRRSQEPLLRESAP